MVERYVLRDDTGGPLHVTVSRCPACGSGQVTPREDGGGGCTACAASFPVEGGLLECFPGTDAQHVYWEAHYARENQDPIAEALSAGLGNPRLLLAHYPLARMMHRLGRKLGSSVELGCGSGSFSLMMKKMGYVERVTLVDYSRASLEAARALFERFGEDCDLVHASLDSLPFAEGAFDLALSAGVIEHYRTDRERLACLESHLGVAPLAYLQAPVSSPLYWASRWVFSALKGGWPFGYERPVTMRELKRHVRLSGAVLLMSDHQYFGSFPLFTRFYRLPRPGWYTRPLQNEIAVLADKES